MTQFHDLGLCSCFSTTDSKKLSVGGEGAIWSYTAAFTPDSGICCESARLGDADGRGDTSLNTEGTRPLKFPLKSERGLTVRGRGCASYHVGGAGLCRGRTLPGHHQLHHVPGLLQQSQGLSLADPRLDGAAVDHQELVPLLQTTVPAAREKPHSDTDCT